MRIDFLLKEINRKNRIFEENKRFGDWTVSFFNNDDHIVIKFEPRNEDSEFSSVDIEKITTTFLKGLMDVKSVFFKCPEKYHKSFHSMIQKSKKFIETLGISHLTTGYKNGFTFSIFVNNSLNGKIASIVKDGLKK
jgi:hypothetical protein